MSILNSTWLIKMLEKSSQSPQARMLNLFVILEDWLDSPNVADSDVNAQPSQLLLSQLQQANHAPLLQDFLTLEAAKAGAAMPEMLANQLYFMAIAATQDKLQANNHKASHHINSFSHAKSAAQALILAQTKKEYRFAKSSVYAIAASFFGVLLVAGSVFMFQKNTAVSPAFAQASFSEIAAPVAISTGLVANPNDTAALFAQIELMRKGNCQLIEALQLPDSYKKVYFENIVLGQISTNPADQKLVHQLLEKVRCNYTPMLMANSK